MSDFLKQVAALKGENIDERPLAFEIKIDGAMAIAWIPYKFFLTTNCITAGWMCSLL